MSGGRKIASSAGLFLTLSCLLALTSIFPSSCLASYEANGESVKVRLIVNVLDIIQSEKLAQIKIVVFITNFPYNESEVEMMIDAGGIAIVSCSRGGLGPNGWSYHGESDQTVWLLDGSGEVFPFDSYALRFRILWIDFVGENFTLLSEGHQAGFDGPRAYYLKDLWRTDTLGLIPIGGNETHEISFTIERSVNNLAVAFLEFVVPIIACYYLLGSTLMLNPEKQLAERLRIYLSLFVFAPTFLFAIQKFLPYRSSLAFPELLLLNLVVSNAILGIFSVVGRQNRLDGPEITRLYADWRVWRFKHGWDVIGAVLSLLIFAIIYSFTLFPKMTWTPVLVFIYGILPAYLFWMAPIITKEQLTKRWLLFLIPIVLFLIPAVLWFLTR